MLQNTGSNIMVSPIKLKLMAGQGGDEKPGWWYARGGDSLDEAAKGALKPKADGVCIRPEKLALMAGNSIFPTFNQVSVREDRVESAKEVG